MYTAEPQNIGAPKGRPLQPRFSVHTGTLGGSAFQYVRCVTVWIIMWLQLCLPGRYIRMGTATTQWKCLLTWNAACMP